jgi:hypothetical protein
VKANARDSSHRSAREGIANVAERHVLNRADVSQLIVAAKKPIQGSALCVSSGALKTWAMPIAPFARQWRDLAFGRSITFSKRAPFASAVIPYHGNPASRAFGSPIRRIVPNLGLPLAVADQ